MLETVREYALSDWRLAERLRGRKNRHLAWCLTVAATAMSTPFGILALASLAPHLFPNP